MSNTDFQNLNLVDCTCRDGSYVNDYSLSLSDVKGICETAQKAKVGYIEVGHGLGVSGYRYTTKGAHDDLSYCRTASEVLSESKWGTFCISHLVKEEDLEPILALSPAFVKLGIDLGKYEELDRNTKLLQRYGVKPVYFMMKTYAWDDSHIKDMVVRSMVNDAMSLYIVDSAGTMLPDDVQRLVYICKSTDPDVEVGFHGHNNLGMAIANSIHAIRHGANHVDASMLGIGRSMGNACIEQLIIILQRMGFDIECDAKTILSYSDRELIEFLRPNLISSSDIAMGISGFHSSFTGILTNSPYTRDLPLAEVIIEMSKLTLMKPSEENLKTVSEIIKNKK